MNVAIIITFVIIVIILISIIRNKHKEAEKYRKDWEFCKKLLKKEREKNKEDIRDELPVFEVGIPNLAKDDNTIKVRKFINYEFRLDFDKTPLKCTKYVQYKVLKELGIKIDWAGRVGPRHGAVWSEQLLKLGRYKVLDKLDIPKKGCSMSFTAGCPVPPGHVAYVEDVLEDDSILISEANWPPPGQKEHGHYNERPLTKKEWQNKYKGKFVDFS